MSETKTSSIKQSRFSRKSFIIFAIIFGLIGGYAIYRSFALSTGYTCAWTGAGSNNNISNASNWSGCNGAAPLPGDNDVLQFNSAVLSHPSNQEFVYNDLTNATFSTIWMMGNQDTDYIIDGNNFTLTAGMSVDHYDGTLLYISNNITFSGLQVMSVQRGNIELAGVISGSGDMWVTGASDAKVRLDGVNGSWSGNVRVAAAALSVYNVNALGNTVGNTTVNDGGVLQFVLPGVVSVAEPLDLAGKGRDTRNYALGFSGGDLLTLTGHVTLSADATVSPGDGPDDIVRLTGGLSVSHAASSLTVAQGKLGSLVIDSSPNGSSSTNGTYRAPKVSTTYTNTSDALVVGYNETAILDGTRSSVTVNAGGNLKGTGHAGATSIKAGGYISPGHSPGCLFTANLSLHGSYRAELGGTTACSKYDRIKVKGTANVSDAKLIVSLNPTSYKPKAGSKFIILSNDSKDKISTRFHGLAEGATLKVKGYTFRITYKGNDGNDVVLTRL